MLWWKSLLVNKLNHSHNCKLIENQQKIRQWACLRLRARSRQTPFHNYDCLFWHERLRQRSVHLGLAIASQMSLHNMCVITRCKIKYVVKFCRHHLSRHPSICQAMDVFFFSSFNVCQNSICSKDAQMNAFCSIRSFFGWTSSSNNANSSIKTSNWGSASTPILFSSIVKPLNNFNQALHIRFRRFCLKNNYLKLVCTIVPCSTSFFCKQLTSMLIVFFVFFSCQIVPLGLTDDRYK